MGSFRTFGVRATGASTTASIADRFGDYVDAKRDFGVKADGSTNDTAAMQAAIDAAFVVCTSNSQSLPITNRPLILPRGQIIVRGSGVRLTGTFGAIMRGAGRFATQIINADGGNVITTQGCQYTHFSDFLLQTSGTGTCFDLDWDGAHNCALQSNEFENIYFLAGANGCRIGNSGFQGSENLFKNCFWNAQSNAGLITLATNALQNTILGGNFQTCNYAIWVAQGSVTGIYSVGFQESTLYDIRINDFVGNLTEISGCRSESKNFVQSGLFGVKISTCLHATSQGQGDFLAITGGAATVNECAANLGRIVISGSPRLKVRNCAFNRPDAIQASSLWNLPNGNTREAVIELENVTIGNWVYRNIRRQRITAANVAGDALTRTYELEAAALSDTNIIYDSARADVTLTIASPCVATLPFTDLVNGTPVIFTTSGALPTGLTASTIYYVINSGYSSAATFRVSATVGGAAINTTGTQSGDHSVHVARTVAVGDTILKINVAAGGSSGWICTTAGVVGGGAVFKALASVAA